MRSEDESTVVKVIFCISGRSQGSSDALFIALLVAGVIAASAFSQRRAVRQTLADERTAVYALRRHSVYRDAFVQPTFSLRPRRCVSSLSPEAVSFGNPPTRVHMNCSGTDM